MIPSSKLRIALIGLGKIAQKAYLPIAANHPKVHPILCTRSTATLQQLTAKYRIDERYSHLDELIQAKPDAAMVHSATDSHFAIVSQLLQANIPVFVDKPLCYSLTQSEELLDIAKQKQVLVYLGFNRRFAPLVQSLRNQPKATQILWQKNRVNQPGNPRVFVFDDFIHVVDSLRFLASDSIMSGPVEQLQVFPTLQKDQLESIHVQWQQNGVLLTGMMNRVSGITEERVEYYTNGNKWLINELSSGVHFHNEQQRHLGFDNWTSTLDKRGFVNLFEDWLMALQANSFQTNRIQDIWETHHLCEKIVQEVAKKANISI